MDDDDFSDPSEIGTDVSDDDSEWEGTKQELYEKISRKFRPETTIMPQPSAGFGKSQFGIRPDKIFPTRRGKPFRLRYRKDDKDLYRYDKRPYETIFLEGFRPWNDKVPRSMRHHIKYMQKSAFVSTTREYALKLAFPPAPKPKWTLPKLWGGLPSKTTNRYVIKAPGGMDLLATLKTQAYAWEQEVMFWKGIRPEFIDRVEVVNKEGRILKVVRRDEWEEERARELREVSRYAAELAGNGAAQQKFFGKVSIPPSATGLSPTGEGQHRLTFQVSLAAVPRAVPSAGSGQDPGKPVSSVLTG
ncbi:hypothetical protein ACFVFJ_50325, partial [Streptomyces sp. NPDC057717]